MPRVSVVVSTYDRPALLAEALASLAAQTYRDFEVVVVNDGGPDARGVVEALPQRPGIRMCYEHRHANRGVAATRNHGIALGAGELIAYLDDDDLWRSNHLQDLVAQLDAHSQVQLVYGDAEIWRMAPPSPNGAQRPSPDWLRGAVRTLAVPYDDELMRTNDFIVPGAMLHTRALYDETGPFDESLWVSDDWDWLLRARERTAFVRCPRIVIAVRIWSGGGNLSAVFDERRLAALREIERRHGTPRLEPKTFWEVAETLGDTPGP